MPSLFEVAKEHERLRTSLADRTARRVVRLFRGIDPGALDSGWDRVAPLVEGVVTRAQVSAARQSIPFTNAAAGDSGPKLVPEAFGGVSREGREIAPELFAAVSTTKRLISLGSGVPAAFRAGTGLMSVMAATLVADAGRSADRTLSVGKGSTMFVRVVSADACSRCAVLAGVTGYRTDFDRHPRCRCTSMPIRDGVVPDGFHDSPSGYFNSLSASEQERVFTKAGAEAIRAGADPVKVVNARRGALTSVKRADGSYSMARLRPTVIGRRADGSPLTVYATPEGTTARSSWARSQQNLSRTGDERYRRTQTVRLMPEQIMSMASTPERATELLKRYGYLY